VVAEKGEYWENALSSLTGSCHCHARGVLLVPVSGVVFLTQIE
jgi:hypothetical protein